VHAETGQYLEALDEASGIVMAANGARRSVGDFVQGGLLLARHGGSGKRIP
jgi:hypothetical protein